MTNEAHEKGMLAAQDLMYDVAYTDYGQTVVEKDAAEQIIRAYLQASGLVLVPQHMSREVDEHIVLRMRVFHDISEQDWRMKCPKDFFRLAHRIAQEQFPNPFESKLSPPQTLVGELQDSEMNEDKEVYRKTRALLALHDHGTREGATASKVKSAMIEEGFTLKEIEEAARSYGR